MTQEERQLFLIDLSARFPYNVAIRCKDEESRFICYLTSDMLREIQNNTCYWDYKPYLFPLSNMTWEQECQYREVIASSLNHYEVYDWLNKNHFDYRSLIEKGLAIDATNKNIY